MLGIVIRIVATRMASTEDKEDMKSLVVNTMADVAQDESSVISGLQWAREKIVGSGNWLSRKLLWPCYAFLALILTLLVAPIAAVLIFG